MQRIYQMSLTDDTTVNVLRTEAMKLDSADIVNHAKHIQSTPFLNNRAWRMVNVFIFVSF